MPRVLLAALAAAVPAALPAAPAAAEQPGFFDLLTPERVLTGIAQSGIMALRTQMDIKYDTMSVDLLAGRIALTDVDIWPLPDWDENGDCLVALDRITLRSTAFDEPDRLRLRLDATGVSAPAICLPPDLRETLALAGLDALEMPGIGIDIVYDVPGAEAEVAAHATIEGVVAATLTADFSYLWFDGRGDMEAPDPVVFLDHAQLRLDDLGLWTVVEAMMPPPFTDPATATMVVPGMIGQMLAEANRDARPDAPGDPSALGPAQRAFLDSVARTWPDFLADPATLVLETQVAEPGYLDFVAFEEDPREIFEALNPVLSTAPIRRPDMLPAELLRRALAGDAGLTAAERRRAGLALARGEGAPRNLPAAVGLLSELAESDGEAAGTLSDALAVSAPEDAYLWALRAGAAGAPGATGLLDRLEAVIGLPRALALQAEVTPLVLSDPGTSSLAALRETAAAHQLGQGRARSYPLAAAWALLARAAGDREAGRILDDLGDRARRSGPAAQAAWTEAEAEASRAATELWLAGNMPARFAP